MSLDFRALGVDGTGLGCLPQACGHQTSVLCEGRVENLGGFWCHPRLVSSIPLPPMSLYLEEKMREGDGSQSLEQGFSYSEARSQPGLL